MYSHFAGSLHLYDRHNNDAKKFLSEGWQGTEEAAMPPMPIGDPWPAIRVLRRAEAAIRSGTQLDTEVESLDPYWRDLVRLLMVFGHFKRGETEAISRIKLEMQNRVYVEYIAMKEEAR